jgi:hypothetical protein
VHPGASTDGVCRTRPWAVAGDGPGDTWTTNNAAAAGEIAEIVRQPDHHRRPDYILLGSWHAHPTGRAEVRAAELVNAAADGGTWASDHNGLVADVDFDLGPDPEAGHGR